jgi:hypothetical protein
MIEACIFLCAFILVVFSHAISSLFSCFLLYSLFVAESNNHFLVSTIWHRLFLLWLLHYFLGGKFQEHQVGVGAPP